VAEEELRAELEGGEVGTFVTGEQEFVSARHCSAVAELICLSEVGSWDMGVGDWTVRWECGTRDV
jgi:hypothetical protein